MRKGEFKAGDEGSGECSHCKTIVKTRYEHRTVRLRRTKVDVPDLLVAVCTVCDHTVRIPRQSFAQLRETGGK
jgi:RNase P subunit RPR2